MFLYIFLVAGAVASAQTTLADRYRAGRIILRADEDWTSNLPADSADWRFKMIVMTGRSLYGLLEFKDDPDGFLHLVRTVFRPK